METFLQDVRYGFRTLMKAPGFTLMAVLVITLGIGANTAIFSVVHAVLLQQLPFKDPQQLASIWEARTDGGQYPLSIPDFEDYQSQSRAFEQMAAFTFWGANITGQGEPERIFSIRTSANFFQVTGASAYLGRTLLPDDDAPGSPHVAVMTYGLWQRRFGGDRAMIGKDLKINGEAYTVVGVLPPSFFFPIRAADMAVPLSPQTDPKKDNRSDHFLNAIGRLRAGVSRAQASSELDAITRHLRQQYPVSNAKNTGVTLVALYDEIVGKFRSALLILMGAVGLLLLIACSSLANLLLARASARQREIAIRTALGASSQRIVRQLVTETLLLSLFGGITGMILAAWGVKALIAMSPADLPRTGDIGVDAPVLWFAAGLSLLSGLVFGIVPALQSVNSNFDHLRGSGALAEGAGRGSRARAFIVSAQVALSLVLLVGSGLLLKSFARLQAVTPGFNPDHVLAMRISLPPAAFPTGASVVNFYTELQQRIESLPGVRSAGAVSIMPLSGPNASVDFTIIGRPPSSPDNAPGALYRVAGPGYFKSVEIPLLQGRTFTENDTAQSATVAVVSHTFATRFFGSNSPLGQHLSMEKTPDLEIIGVVSDVKQVSLDEDPQADIYVPYSQLPEWAINYLRNNMFWAVRTTGDPLTLAAPVRHELRSLQKDAPISRLGAMEDYLAASAAPRRFNLLLVGMFAATALLLAVLGVYGVISYSVTRRTREFGVRLALGAQRRDVLSVVMTQAARLVGAGILVGLFGAIASTRLLGDLLFHVQPTDTTTYFAVVGLVVAVALTACFIPARRAAKVDPMVALRYE